VAALGARAAACFKASRAPGTDDIAPRFERRLPRPLALVVCFAALGLANAVTHRGLQPIVVKSFVETRSTGFLYERWNYFSRISADSRGLSRPELWGPSPLMPHDMVTEQIHLSIDGLAGTAMFRFDDQHPPVFLDYDITNLAYFLKRNGRAAIIGVGSGRDVLSAWHFGFRDVTGVEINPIFIDLLTRTEPFRSFAGIAPLAGVRLINDEARSWFARSRETFDLIQMSMIDTWAATGAGAFTLSENGLYTVDGWRHFLARLGDGGVFTVSRWHAPGDLNETGRLMSLATAALLERGIRDPGRHLFLAASGRAATLILSLEPLGEESLSTLRAACDRFGYSVILAPDQRAESDNLRGILESASREALDRFTSRADFDLTPPTDDRPFFFNLLRLDRPLAVFRVQRSGFGVLSGNLLATMTLLTILVVSLFLVVLTILVPLRPAAKASGRSLVAAGTVYFALLGLGFMFVEIGLLQRLSVLLGHPIYSLSVVLFSLILSTGVGSLAASVVRLESRAALFVSWAACTGVYLLTLVVALPGLISRFEGTGLLAHVALSLGLLAPAGLLMGFGFPVGMRMVQAIDERPTPWFWGINGAAGVLASVLAIATSLAFGISRSILLGACCYLALIVPGLYLGFRLPARARPAGR
jgi:hypothetical protein